MTPTSQEPKTKTNLNSTASPVRILYSKWFEGDDTGEGTGTAKLAEELESYIGKMMLWSEGTMKANRGQLVAATDKIITFFIVPPSPGSHSYSLDYDTETTRIVQNGESIALITGRRLRTEQHGEAKEWPGFKVFA